MQASTRQQVERLTAARERLQAALQRIEAKRAEQLERAKSAESQGNTQSAAIHYQVAQQLQDAAQQLRSQMTQFEVQFTGAPSRPTAVFPPNIVGGALAAEAVGFLLIGFVFWRLTARRARREVGAMLGDQSAKVQRLEQSLDVIAVEVQRIADGQRAVAAAIRESR